MCYYTGGTIEKKRRRETEGRRRTNNDRHLQNYGRQLF